jgi:hypothetical protein
VDKSPGRDLRQTVREAEEEFRGVGARSEDGDAKSIHAVVSHELERVEEEGED